MEDASTRRAACPACGAESFVVLSSSSGAGGDGAGTCERCGHATGEPNRCPHCKIVARALGAGQSLRCASCGGPRIPGNLGGERAKVALAEQARALVTGRVASIATVIQALLAAAITVIGIVVHPTTLAGKAVAFGIALVPLVLALSSRARAGRARANARAAHERAWQAAAEDVAARSSDGVTVETLATTLGIDASAADRLLTSLTVHERTRIDVGDDAKVRYSARPSDLAPETDAFSADDASAADDTKLEA